jgi:hypothetical protein
LIYKNTPLRAHSFNLGDKAMMTPNIPSPNKNQPASSQPQASIPSPTPKQEPVDPKKQKDAERLRQRIAAKQYVLASMGIDWTPDEEDMRNEHAQLPDDGESIVQWKEIQKPKEQPSMITDFEPFMPDPDEEGYVRLAEAEEQPTPQPVPNAVPPQAEMPPTGPDNASSRNPPKTDPLGRPVRVPIMDGQVLPPQEVIGPY